MIKQRFGAALLLLFALVGSEASASSKSPNDSPTTTAEVAGFLRLIAELHPDLSLLAETARTTQSVGPSPYLSSALLGTYYQPYDSIRFGLFYRRMTGALYDEDWQNDGSGWGWLPVKGRSENQLILDFSPRVPLSIRHPEDSVLEGKIRFLQSDLYHHRVIQFRPGILHPILRDGEPLWVLNGAMEFYFPLNGSDRFLYEFWSYVGATFRWMPGVEFSLQIAYLRRFWDETPEFRMRTGEAFTLSHSSLTSQVGFIFRLGHD